MNNLTAGRVLLAIAEGSGEDFPFRLNNPGPAASRRRSAIVVGAVAPNAFCCPDNRAVLNAQHRRAR
jgi:hypothetical protein